MTDRPSVTSLVLAAVATMRLTRLVTKDYLTETPRRWVQRRAPEKIGYLFGCPWCASFWLAVPVAGLTVWRPRSRLLLAACLALTASQVSGLGANLDVDAPLGADEGTDFAGELSDQQLRAISLHYPGTGLAGWAVEALNGRSPVAEQPQG